MEIDNNVFDGYPIDFKKINPNDFPDFIVGDKIILEPDSNNRINNAFQNAINFTVKNTVVVNASVGQGKTYAIIQVVKRYFDLSDDYIIFVASPFISLVDQYTKKIEEVGISEENIFRYENIGPDFQLYINKRVHIVTANLLLGDPGEKSLLNNADKRNYINRMSSFCEEKSKKTIFIYDEVHDSTNIFREQLIFNLYKWKSTIQKNFILSATYSEASKVAIKYLSELTDKKIEIIETNRNQIENPSNLFLHFDNSKKFDGDNGTLEAIFSDLNQRGLDYDILSFSKKLANELFDRHTSSGKLIYNKYGNNRKLCISNKYNDLNDFSKNRYDEQKCNIGTNFKTGVSIEKENHSFVLILPSEGASGNYENYFGIFSGGQNSVIQALARQRKQGEIHIVLPPPIEMDMTTLSFNNQERSNYFISNYQEVQKILPDSRKGKYYSFGQQSELLLNFYTNTLKANIIQEIEFVNTERTLSSPSLRFPAYDDFVLQSGDDYLARAYEIYGKDLSLFVTYSALTNQFVNCRLFGIERKSPLYFTKGSIQKTLNYYLENYYTIELYNSLFIESNDLMNYNLIKKDLLNNHILFYRDSPEDNYSQFNLDSKSDFDKELIAFIQRISYFNNTEFSLRYRFNEINDFPFKRGEYFQMCIAHTMELEVDEEDNSTQGKLIKGYKILNYFRLKFSEKRVLKDNEYSYLPKKLDLTILTEDDKVKFEKMKSYLLENDKVLGKDVFNFKRSLSSGDNIYKQMNTFYNYCIEDFYEKSNERLYRNGKEIRIWKIDSLKIIPEKSKVINFISDSNYRVNTYTHISDIKKS